MHEYTQTNIIILKNNTHESDPPKNYAKEIINTFPEKHLARMYTIFNYK